MPSFSKKRNAQDTKEIFVIRLVMHKITYLLFIKIINKKERNIYAIYD